MNSTLVVSRPDGQEERIIITGSQAVHTVGDNALVLVETNTGPGQPVRPIRGWNKGDWSRFWFAPEIARVGTN